MGLLNFNHASNKDGLRLIMFWIWLALYSNIT